MSSTSSWRSEASIAVERALFPRCSSRCPAAVRALMNVAKVEVKTYEVAG